MTCIYKISNYFDRGHPIVFISDNYFIKAGCAYGSQPYHLLVPTVLKSGTLNLLEASETVQVCNGIALPFTIDTT